MLRIVSHLSALSTTRRAVPLALPPYYPQHFLEWLEVLEWAKIDSFRAMLMKSQLSCPVLWATSRSTKEEIQRLLEKIPLAPVTLTMPDGLSELRSMAPEVSLPVMIPLKLKLKFPTGQPSRIKGLGWTASTLSAMNAPAIGVGYSFLHLPSWSQPMINNIIIIMSCHYHGYPWPSLAISPYRSSPPAGLQGYIPYPYIAAVCMFELVVLLLLGHMWRSIGVHHLWARPCFSSMVLHVWFV